MPNKSEDEFALKHSKPKSRWTRPDEAVDRAGMTRRAFRLLIQITHGRDIFIIPVNFAKLHKHLKPYIGGSPMNYQKECVDS